MTYCTRTEAKKYIDQLLSKTKEGTAISISRLGSYERTIMYALLALKYIIATGKQKLPPYTYTWSGRYPDEKDIDRIYGFLDLSVEERGSLNFSVFLNGQPEPEPASEPVSEPVSEPEPVPVTEKTSGDGIPEALRAYSPTEIWDELKARGFKPEGNAIFRIVQLS